MENETSDVQPKCQGPLQLLSPPFSWPAPLNRCGQTEGGPTKDHLMARSSHGKALEQKDSRTLTVLLFEPMNYGIFTNALNSLLVQDVQDNHTQTRFQFYNSFIERHTCTCAVSVWQPLSCDAFTDYLHKRRLFPVFRTATKRCRSRHTRL